MIYNNEYRLHDMIIARCRQAGFTPRITLETSQRDLMLQMVAANLGIALLPQKLCAKLDVGDVVYRPLVDPQVYLKLAFTWKKGRYLSHAAREFLRFVRATGLDDESVTCCNRFYK
ncbi:hypothetical protein HA075_17920 [bacterium BFN5]|nr:hypothetical protein HA075_17920 [bacterium BFN5]